MVNSNNLLFFRDGILELPQLLETEMNKAIDAIEGNKLLNTNSEDLANYFEQDYKIDVPKLKKEEITVDQNEAKIDVSHDPFRYIPNGRPFYITGTNVTYYVPFEGDAGLFQLHASTFTFNPPRAEIAGNELKIVFVFEKGDPKQIGERFKNLS